MPSPNYNLLNHILIKRYSWNLLIPLLAISLSSFQKKESLLPIPPVKAVQLNLPTDTLKILTINKLPNSTWLSAANMPWIVTLLIGASTVLINVFIAKMSRKNTFTQIENSLIIALKQIESSKELAKTNFNANLSANNRQKWIDELRNTLSELIANGSMIVGCESSDKMDEYITKTSLLKAKIDLLLNTHKSEHIAVIEATNNFVISCKEQPFDINKFHQAKSEILQAGRNLFAINWEKIKNVINT
jgi:outer membrane murein-binding lipoprotein Lpp